MKAVILAAGEGSRMRPLTYTRPKVMLPIANKPILEHLLIEAEKAGIREFIFIVGYHDEQVRNYFGNGDKWGVNIDYSTQRKQLGTADALRMVEGLVDGNFLMINGDIIVNQEDIKSLAAGKNITMSLAEVEDTEDLGLVEISKDKGLSHVGSCVGMAEVLEEVHEKAHWKDLIVLDGGHAGLALYVALEQYEGRDAEYLFNKHGVHHSKDRNQ